MDVINDEKTDTQDMESKTSTLLEQSSGGFDDDKNEDIDEFLKKNIQEKILNLIKTNWMILNLIRTT